MRGNLQVRFGRRAIREKGQVKLAPRPAPYLASTASKWGISQLDALRDLFNGRTWMPPGLEPSG